jgi:autotransporter family porin
VFKLNPLLLSLLAAQGLMLPATPVSAVVLKPFTSERNDNKVGAYCLCNGSTQTLSGVPRFTAGESGMSSVTLGELQKVGRIINDNLIGEPRLQLGAQNYAIVFRMKKQAVIVSIRFITVRK